MTAKQCGRNRKNLGWTQERLAKELGVGRSTLTKYENGTQEIPDLFSNALRNLVKLRRYEEVAA